jgi:hypothetical protein
LCDLRDIFDLAEPADYHAGEIHPIGAFTARIDLAHYLLALADEPASAGKTGVVSTTEGTPAAWQMILREAGAKTRHPPEPDRSIEVTSAGSA